MQSYPPLDKEGNICRMGPTWLPKTWFSTMGTSGPGGLVVWFSSGHKDHWGVVYF